MRGRKIWDAMGEVDGALIEETARLLAGEAGYGKGRIPAKRWIFGKRRRFGAGVVMRIGVMAALVIFLGENYRSVPEEFSVQQAKREYLVQRAASPERLENHVEMNADEKMESEEGKKVSRQDSMSPDKSAEDTSGAAAFYEKSLREVFLNHAEENVVYSPVSLYLATGMLSEMGSGNTRREILDAMGVNDLQEVRENCKDLWSRLCWRGNTFQSTLGQSLWMGEGLNYSEEMVGTLAEQHYASSFQGAAGEERALAVEEWLSDFLTPVPRERGEQVSQGSFDLLSVIACEEAWREGEGFDGKGTKKGIFYQKDGRERNVSFLQGTVPEKNVTAAEGYCSVNLGLAGGNHLSVYLPKEGVDLEEILQKDLGEILSHFGEGENEGGKQNRVTVSLPKFEVTSDLSLNAELEKMGVQDAFQEGVADFSPLVAGKEGGALEQDTSPAAGEVRQSTRIVLDEAGCGTEVCRDAERAEEDANEDGKGNEEYFTCNRPFLFILWSTEGTPVLAGTIYIFQE